MTPAIGRDAPLRDARPSRCGRAPAAATLALVPALLLVACSRGPAPVHVLSVRVVGGTLAEPLREAGVDEAAMEAAARAALSEAGFRLGEGARAHRAEASVSSVELLAPGASGGAARAEIAIELALTPAEPGRGGARREEGTGAVALSGVDPREAWGAALRDAAREAAASLALAFSEEAKTDEQVIADLSAGDARVRDHAVRVLGDRRSRAAVPALLERLEDPEPRVAHRTVGALAQIGDERAVAPLIELSRSEDPARAARVARLIGDIGGAEAEGYLLTLEAGHADPRVRRAAGEALAEMRARAEQTPGPSARSQDFR